MGSGLLWGTLVESSMLLTHSIQCFLHGLCWSISYSDDNSCSLAVNKNSVI